MLKWTRDVDDRWLVTQEELDIVGYGRTRAEAAILLSLAAMDYAKACASAPDYYAALVDGFPGRRSLLEAISNCLNLVAVRRFLGLLPLDLLGLSSKNIRSVGDRHSNNDNQKTRSVTGRVVGSFNRKQSFCRRVISVLTEKHGMDDSLASAAVQAAGFQRHLACDVEYAIYRGANYWAARLAKSHKMLEHTRTTPG